MGALSIFLPLFLLFLLLLFLLYLFLLLIYVSCSLLLWASSSLSMKLLFHILSDFIEIFICAPGIAHSSISFLFFLFCLYSNCILSLQSESSPTFGLIKCQGWIHDRAEFNRGAPPVLVIPFYVPTPHLFISVFTNTFEDHPFKLERSREACLSWPLQ